MKRGLFELSRAIAIIVFVSHPAAAVSAQAADPTDAKKPGVAIYSIAFGEFGENNRFTEKRKFEHEPGRQYGWKLEVNSTAGKVRIKEVFELPGTAPWPEEDPTLNDPQIKNYRRELSKDKSKQTIEFDLICGEKMAVFGQAYTIVAGDPKGKHVITVSIDGQEAGKFPFVIE